MTVIWRVPRPLLVHLISVDDWARAKVDRRIAPASLQAEGFVHLSTSWQAGATAARYYGGRADLLALAIDPGGLQLDRLRWEESHPGQFFPHHYAPLSPAAVVAASPWIPPDGLGEGEPWPLPPGFPSPPVTQPLPEGARVRMLGPDDGAAVGALVAAAVAARRGTLDAGTLDAGTLARAQERLVTPGGWGVGVELAGHVSGGRELVSVVLGVPMRADRGEGPPVPGWCHVGTVMTQPDRWGYGFATRALVEAVSVMRARGDTHAELWTQVDNARARAVYERLDWVRSDVPDMVFEGEVLTHLTLTLRP